MKAHIRKKCFSGEKRELEKDVQTFFSRKKNFFLITANDKFSVSRRINRLRNQFFRINFCRFSKKKLFLTFFCENRRRSKVRRKIFWESTFLSTPKERRKERRSRKNGLKSIERKKARSRFSVLCKSVLSDTISYSEKKGREMSLIRLLLRKKLTHARTRTHMHAHTRTHTHTHTLLHSHMLYYIQSVPQWQSIAISLFLSNSHIPSHSHTQSFSITFSSTISLSLTLSLSHTLSLIHMRKIQQKRYPLHIANLSFDLGRI